MSERLAHGSMDSMQQSTSVLVGQISTFMDIKGQDHSIAPFNNSVCPVFRQQMPLVIGCNLRLKARKSCHPNITSRHVKPVFCARGQQCITRISARDFETCLRDWGAHTLCIVSCRKTSKENFRGKRKSRLQVCNVNIAQYDALLTSLDFLEAYEVAASSEMHFRAR